MSNALASQVVLEVLSQIPASVAHVRASQLVMSILTTSARINPPPPFPSPAGSPSGFLPLKGLSYSVLKTIVGSSGIVPHQSGREVRINYYPSPLWQWELTFDYLPDLGIADSPTTPAVSDYQLLRAFFTSTYGGVYPFFFFDPDDYQVTNQTLGLTDGARMQFQLVRTYGAGGFQTIEPVGLVNIVDFPFHIYIDDVLADPASYKLTTTQYANQFITFPTPPAAGKIVSVDMTYYYFARFMDPFIEFEEFLHRIYMLKKLRIESRRSA